MKSSLPTIALVTVGLFEIGLIVLLCLPLFLSRSSRRESRMEQEGEDAVAPKAPGDIAETRWGIDLRFVRRRECRACQDWRCQCYVPDCPQTSPIRGPQSAISNS